jgi:ATP-dependent Clp protease ATP-binding subunit ClpA
VLLLARKEADRCNAPRVEVDHVLFALLEEGEGVAVAVLDRLNVNMNRLRGQLYSRNPAVTEEAVRYGERPYSAELKDVFTRSAEVALECRHMYVGTEHLLLGILHERRGAGCELLQSEGVTYENALSATRRLLGQDETPAN